MSAQEVIEQIKLLPPEEKARVADFMQTMENEEAQKKRVTCMDDVTFDAAKKSVFTKHAELLRKLAK